MLAFLKGAWTGVKALSGGLVAKVWSGLSLYLGYIAIGFAIALGCAAVWFYHQNSALHEAVGELNKTVEARAQIIETLKDNNAQQDLAIGELAALRRTDKAVVTGLLSDYKRINSVTSDTKAKIRELEKRNEEVRYYLNTPLPASVRRVLNGQAETGSDSADGHKG